MSKTNCGLEALGKIVNFKNISMYTLLQLAKDNNLNLYFCKVDVKDLPLVKRPAVFHANNHFILAEDNKALEEANYSGYVLTSKAIGKPLPYSLAKTLIGGKKGGDFIGPVVVGIASIVNPWLGAAVGAGFQAHKVTGGAGVTNTPGELWRIPIGGALGYLGGTSKPLIGGLSNAVLAGGLAGAAELPGAIKSGNFAAPLLAGLGAGLGQKFTSTLASGFQAPASGLGERFGNAVGALTGKGASSTGVAQSTRLAGGGLSNNLGLSGGTTPAGYGGTITIPGVSNNISSSSIPALAGSSVLNAQTSAPTTQKGGLLNSIFSGDKSGLLKTAAGALATTAFKPPSYSPDSLSTYDKASQYLKGTSLPEATNTQLNKWLTMPIQDIKSELITPQATNRAMLELDKQYEQALTQVQRAAANAGQSIQTSSDAFNQYQEINRQWAEAKANLQGELEQKALQDAVGIKKWSLEQSIAQGQFDVNSALELAAMINKDQELKYAIESQDYEMFQSVIAEILGGVYTGSQDNKTNTQNNLSSVLGG